MKKILTIVGARPQFIKASAISRVIRDQFSHEFEEIIVHTGQHYDTNMSQVFFEQLDMNEPKYNLNISGLNHGAMTGRMMEALEELMVSESADLVLVYGDTNSTLAGAITASKLHIPIAHVEAGLRSFNRRMPEEINRILTDNVSSFLFCPTDVSVQNLKKEGMTQQVFNVGDVMYDVALYFAEKAKLESDILTQLSLKEKDYTLVTCHREENTNCIQRLTSILQGLAELSKSKTIVFPIHPRTLKYIQLNQLSDYLENIHVIEPLPYMDLIALQQSAELILTDSGGIQKEAFFYQVPCVTMRDETEWVETVDLGWNQLVGANTNQIIDAVMNIKTGLLNVYPYGHGRASQMILNILKNEMTS